MKYKKYKMKMRSGKKQKALASCNLNQPSADDKSISP